MKKMSLLLCVIMMFVLSFNACSKGSGETAGETGSQTTVEDTEEDVQNDNAAVAKKFVDTFNSGDIDKLISDFTLAEETKAAFDTDEMKDQLKALADSLGALLTIEDPEITAQAGSEIYTFLCTYETSQCALIISFNENNEVAGFWITPAEEKTQTGTAETPEGVIETEAALNIGAGKDLPGTLTVPEGEGPFPIVILVHGSGPNDRDETVEGNTPFRDIAWGLAARGVASYRYDKRTYARPSESLGTDFTIYDETIDDAAAAIEMFRDYENISGDQVYLLGHSLGGHVIPLIDKEAGAAGYIMLAGSSSKLSDLLRYQLPFLAALEGEITESAQAAVDEQIAQLDRLNDIDALAGDEMIFGAYPEYWKLLESYDAIAVAETIEVPILVLQGEEDYQVTMDEYLAWKNAYEGKRNWSFKSYPGLTHLFMKGQKENGPADYAQSSTVDQEVISDIVDFVKGI